jgi:DNA-binding PadR family transcriptional regulator
MVREWATVGGRKRRTYRLTESGRKQLQGERSAWQEFTSVIGSVLRSEASAVR